MNTELPDPFVPADVDLRDRDGFLLNVERIAASKLIATELPMLVQPRRRALGRRLRDSFGTLEAWRGYCQRIRGSPFLLGENARGWRADLEFALKPRSISKTLEGGYDRSHPITPKPGAAGRVKPARNPLEFD